MTILATRADALRNPKAHSFKPGKGYQRPGEPTQYGVARRDLCNPPPGASDGSWHLLKPPGGADPIAFQWMPLVKTWFRLDTRARRIGFIPEYLSSYGWTYLGAASGFHG